MNKYEYKIEFESNNNDMQTVIEEITETLKNNLNGLIYNYKPTFTIFSEKSCETCKYKNKYNNCKLNDYEVDDEEEKECINKGFIFWKEIK